MVSSPPPPPVASVSRLLKKDEVAYCGVKLQVVFDRAQKSAAAEDQWSSRPLVLLQGEDPG